VTSSETNTVVVGGGQAGLAVSYLLTQAEVPHVVVERGRVGESWRSQRWDSFALNTPNWSNQLPGMGLDDDSPHRFASRDETVSFLERYAASFDAPVLENTTVTNLEHDEQGEFVVDTTSGAFRSRNVVVCSGALSEPAVPDVAAGVPDALNSISAAEYRNADVLPDGAVIVVGSAQSGCQIVEDLLDAGREVYLCVSKVGRAPRTYRGRDGLAWLRDVGFFDMTVDQLQDPTMQYAAQPQISGTKGGHTVSLQSLARDGARLLGRADGFDGNTLKLVPNVRECAAFADGVCAQLKAMIDGFIETAGIVAPSAEPDPNEPPMPDLGGSDELDELDIGAAGVSTVIWCTGYRGDFSWIRHDIFDERGLPHHEDGVGTIPGLYFAGFPWLSSRKSGILYGVTEDASRIAGLITASR
jgi:putative flavoprotein involved in K+ transport